MMQKRTIYSLLLTSFILAFAFSISVAQTVEFESKSVPRCYSSELDVNVDAGTDISGFEIVFEVASTNGGAWFTAFDVDFHPGLTVLTNRYLDLSGVDNVSPDTVRIAGMLTDPGDACLPAGETPVATVEFTTNDVCEGDVTFSAATVSCEPVPGYELLAQTQLVDCATSDPVSVAVTDGVVTIVNQLPTVDPIADASLPWGTTYTGQIVADDPDLANGCEVLSYSKVTGPAALTVDAKTGAISWTTTGEDVCVHEVEVQVEDGCGATVTTSFEICVTNVAPTVVCPNDTLIGWGDTLNVWAVGDDPDSGPYSLEYSIIGFDGPGSPTIDGVTGEITWLTEYTSDFVGIFTMTVEVTDGANVCDPCSPENADTCSFEIKVVPFLLTIEKTHNTLQGHSETVSITMLDSEYQNYPIGGFDFLFQYDASALVLQSAEPGELLLDCGWEYFTYRFGPNGNCGAGACPTGFVRTVAIAETNNGANHPLCFTNNDGTSVATTANELVKLNFLVTSDLTYECQYAPVRWYWYDCGDNALSSKTGDTLFISRYVYHFDDYLGDVPLEDPNDPRVFPTAFGALDSCSATEILDDLGKDAAFHLIDFINGGIDIICKDSIDATADINLNEIPYEIADAVLFSNYFVYGLGVFHINLPGQIAATDVNVDGITLSVADLVYLIRVIVGDASPYPKAVPSATVEYVQTPSGVLRTLGDVSLGAVLVTFEGDVTPTLLADDMELLWASDGVATRALVWSRTGASFTGDFLRADGKVTSIEFATSEGGMVNVTEVPTTYSLNQNYPNPFNPTTTISFSVEERSDYSLTIYNVNGQVVESFTGTANPGQMEEVEWDASGVASGVYLYKLDASTFTATKKMVLLK